MSFEKKEAYVTYDPAQADIDQMDAALREKGFQGALKGDGVPD